jgi:uncharacterized membrane protein
VGLNVTIQGNKTLGGIGAFLILLGVVGTFLSLVQFATMDSQLNFGILGGSGVIGVLSFVGFILFFVAMHGLSRDYAEPKIFSYIIYGLIITVVLAVAIGIIWFALFLVSIFSLISDFNLTSPTSTAQIQSVIAPYYAPLMAGMAVVLLVWILYNYKAFNLLAEKSGVYLFRTAAKIFVAGAVVNVAVGALFAVLGLLGLIGYYTMLLVSVPGGLIQYVAWGFVAKGFFSIPVSATYFQVSPSSVQGRNCQNCGAPNQADATYCGRCGQKIGA